MAEYIEREALLKSDDWQSLKSDFDKARAHIIILGQPAADVVEVVHAHKGQHIGHKYYCSACGQLAYCENYCSNCGARMDGETK